MKASLQYSFDVAWRHSNLLLPWASPLGRGAWLKGTVEAATAAGDAQFLRGELVAGTAWRLPWRLEWHATTAFGALLPRDGQPSCLQDRFFLGGASGSHTVVKGFTHRGIGPVGSCALAPKDGEATAKDGDTAEPGSNNVVAGRRGATDALGGDAMISAFTALSAPLPLELVGADGGGAGSAIDARIFGFLSAGCLAEKASTAPRALGRALLSSLRASFGFGIGIPVGGLGMFEVTLAKPVLAHPHDEQQRLQLGMRLDVVGP